MSTLLLVRHGIAEDPEIAAQAGIPDHLRALTPKGQKKMRAIAAALARLVPELTLIATSPLLRAVQTANILAAAYEGIPLVQTEVLRPGAPPTAVPDFLNEQRVQGTCALVGHEPDLGRWASWALFGEPRPSLPLKKGGAALLSFPGLPAPGSGELAWWLTPAQLRDLK